ncbi:hypothetical protein DRO32_05435 [Candidatus Bathyarchaeota archaeon]|nr:MAG: hypothetical protein DRO32_05435 [Candidatus Bathyarchaeota archaeon]
MELSRKRARERVMRKFDFLRTCALARELCYLVRTNLAVLDPEDVHRACSFISKLCREAGCIEPSELCSKAAEAVLRDENEFLRLCAQSCKLCGQHARRPRREEEREERERATYVA